MKQDTVRMGFRIPRQLWQEFHDHCEAQGQTKNKVVVHMMDAYLKAVRKFDLVDRMAKVIEEEQKP